MATINQKEYLKKYLKMGSEKGKKKRKKVKPEQQRVKIIDDDTDFSFSIQEDDPFTTNEDAPQIVAIIDERPPSMRIDEKTKDKMWQPIGSAGTSEANKMLDLKSLKLEPKGNDEICIDGKNRSEDNSPVRRKDESPPRRRKNKSLSPSGDYSHPRRVKREASGDDDDHSPPRRRKTASSPKGSPRRKRDHSEDRGNKDKSPPRKKQKRSFSPSQDRSPPRRVKKEPYLTETGDHSPPRRKKQDPPPGKRADDSSWRMQKTADGKSAGLQSVHAMLEESRLLREREEKRFKEMSEQTSGRNAGTILRDRKTGRIRNVEEEQKVQQQKNEEEAKKKEKYSRWGKGLVQTENREQRLQEELHEMSKPLARYADDEDLEKYLKEQERAEDPMLAYMRKKRRKEAVEDGVALKPEFEGQFMPNRYGIRPGHRWDGVDRSNGYEKKWFDVINSKKAQEEESYKWSTEDM